MCPRWKRLEGMVDLKIGDTRVLVLYGPTGVGKTVLVDQLATQTPIEIINMDVGQFYVPLSIGTAKPEWQKSATPHHLFDIIDTPTNLTVVAYRKLLSRIVEDVWKRGKLPVVVGGSGFYLSSLLFPPDQTHNSKGTDEKNGVSWKQLHTVDPERAKNIDPHDTYRIQRALTIWGKSGEKPSSFVPLYDPLYPLHIVHVTRDRQEVVARINQRVDTMISEGLEAEVASLVGTHWEPFIRKKRLIGYDDLLPYCAGPAKGRRAIFDARVIRIKVRTRRYAKRQETFWRMLSRRIAENPRACNDHFVQSVNLTEIDVDQYIAGLLAEIQTCSTQHVRYYAKS